MKILVLTESLRINETSSGIVSSTFLKALTNNSKNNVTCIYNNVFNYKLTWLENINFIEIDNRQYKRNRFVEAIPKLRGLITNITGIHDESLFEINKWEKFINTILKKEKFDLIIALGSGLEFYPHHAMLNIKTTIPWLANFHDPYPISIYPKPYKKKRTYLLKKQELLTKRIIYKANYVSFPSLYLKELMQSEYGFEDKKSIILPHLGIPLNNLPQSELDNSVSFKKNKFNLLHAGTLLGPRKVESLFKAFIRFINSDIKKKDKAVLNILGKVAKENIDVLNKHKSLNNVNIILDRVSYKKSLQLIQDSDVSLIIEADAEISPFMPGKLADLILLDKPIFALTPKKSETIRVLGDSYKYQSGVNDEEQILTILELIWKDWKEGKLNLIDYKKQKEYISAVEFNKKINQLFTC